MKKLLAIILLVICCFGFYGCKEEGKPASPKTYYNVLDYTELHVYDIGNTDYPKEAFVIKYSNYTKFDLYILDSGSILIEYTGYRTAIREDSVGNVIGQATLYRDYTKIYTNCYVVLVGQEYERIVKN